jgi:hypothetical protein
MHRQVHGAAQRSLKVRRGRRAGRCDKEISLSAGLATLLAGKPEDFSANLKYARDELTAHAVERFRANTDTARVAQIR